ncbi:TlpA family protein disulfide reductase [Adhaeretor mobilis]|uniref:Thiol-disulfide oxidoreductase n=1 Tax=Adhaeretor mobilis TaxID=1930276 RepID=A0A517MXI5_9BACT|nr:TlpA disulfide reductase family protein [Adhaeretor mobilis]QDS99569.1 thiol-disulfide oxidoreductase [Adhaeretor mobilis]
MSELSLRDYSVGRMAAFVSLALAISGCAQEVTDPEPGSSIASGSSGVTATSSAAQEATTEGNAQDRPTLHVVDENQFAEILKAHHGEVVLVDCWATWCFRCLELMPHTVELQKNFGDLGLHVILLSLDSPEDSREAAADLLARKGVDFDSYISVYGTGAKSAEAFEIEGGALPSMKLYDRKGKLRRVFSAGHMPPEPFEEEDIAEAVRELLAEE